MAVSIEKMFGIGKKTYPRLIALGINTIGDLAKTEDERVKSLLGNTYLYHKTHALGEGDDIVQPYENRIQKAFLLLEHSTMIPPIMKN